MDTDLLRRSLCVARSAVGISCWVAPGASGRFFGLGDDMGTPEAAVVSRLFGVRDLALAQALRHPSPDVRRLALQAGAVIDSVDVVATALSLRRGVGARAAVLVGLGAAAFAATEAVLLLADRRD